MDPRTIFQRNFTNTNCVDVTFINDDFSGVIKTNAKFKGSNYYELTNSLIKIKNAIKKLGQ